MDRWQAMRVFVKVADAGGFAGAARQLGMSPPAVTRAIAALEETIGTRLLVRTTRSVKLTEAGGHYLEDCRRILSDITEAEAAAAGSYATPTGTLTVTAPVLFGQIYVMPILTEYLDRHPAVTGRVLLLDRLTNLIDEGMDVAVRIGHLPDSGYSAVRVGSVRRVVCGSPAYLAKHGAPSVSSRSCATSHHRTDGGYGDDRVAFRARTENERQRAPSSVLQYQRRGNFCCHRRVGPDARAVLSGGAGAGGRAIADACSESSRKSLCPSISSTRRGGAYRPRCAHSWISLRRSCAPTA